VRLPPKSEHAFDEDVLNIEETEYGLADTLLCPSEFVASTFADRGFPLEKLSRTIYGFDENRFFPRLGSRNLDQPFTMIFAGFCAVRKGLHFALEAWLNSSASRKGKFLIAGDFLPQYHEKLAPMLSQQSVHVLGHRSDVAELMRNSDVFVLPSIEEGFGLVCTEAMGSGCVPLVSDACTDICKHMENSLVHRTGDVKALTEHITLLYENRDLLARLREKGIALRNQITWSVAAEKLVAVYASTIRSFTTKRRAATAE
jgi:glycosyltransferase involved in cell wall biosynthesis